MKGNDVPKYPHLHRFNINLLSQYSLSHLQLPVLHMQFMKQKKTHINSFATSTPTSHKDGNTKNHQSYTWSVFDDFVIRVNRVR
jgi:hypothetical protein